jgi:hypothetical protein
VILNTLAQIRGTARTYFGFTVWSIVYACCQEGKIFQFKAKSLGQMNMFPKIIGIMIYGAALEFPIVLYE